MRARFQCSGWRRLSVAVAFALAATLLNDTSLPTDAEAESLGDQAAVLELIRADLNEAELTDLRLMAKQDGITLDEAIISFGWHDRFATLANSLERDYPSQFTGARISDSKGRRAWIGFKGPVPAAAVDKIASFPVAAVAARGNRGFSARELDERVILAHRSVTASPEVNNATSYYDLETGAVTVEAGLRSREVAADPERREMVRRSLTQSLPAQARSWPVLIEVNSASNDSGLDTQGHCVVMSGRDASTDTPGGWGGRAGTALNGS